MPITPLHFGPALAVKAAAPRRVSFLAFAVTQLAIDAEVVFYLFNDMWPVHRFFHTYLGSTLIAVATVVIGVPLLRAAVRGWNRIMEGQQRGGFRIEPRVPVLPAIVGALLGSWSHVLLDSMLYTDMKPLAPVSTSNALLGLLAGFEVYLLCVVLGVLGALVLLFAFLREKFLSANKP